jgi:uncharacterized protein (TIGR00369 family)
MTNLAEAIRTARATGHFSAFLAELPYTRMLGLMAEREGEVVRLVLPFRPGLVGNPIIPAFHGGVVGACLETAAILQILQVRAAEGVPKTIDFTVDYLRTARAETLYADAEVQRSGRRIVNVRMRAYQSDPGAPVALGRGHFLID